MKGLISYNYINSLVLILIFIFFFGLILYQIITNWNICISFDFLINGTYDNILWIMMCEELSTYKKIQWVSTKKAGSKKCVVVNEGTSQECKDNFLMAIKESHQKFPSIFA